MKTIVIGMLAFSMVFIVGFWNDSQPNAEEIVHRPRADVYAELEQLYSAVERKAATVTTVTGRPPVPVVFTFQRTEGEALALTAKAGMRTIELHTWLEDGPEPGQTRMKVRFEPQSMQGRFGPGTILSAVETILWKTEAQLIEGRRVTALFGGSPVPNH